MIQTEKIELTITNLNVIPEDIQLMLDEYNNLLETANSTGKGK